METYGGLNHFGWGLVQPSVVSLGKASIEKCSITHGLAHQRIHYWGSFWFGGVVKSFLISEDRVLLDLCPQKPILNLLPLLLSFHTHYY